MGGVMSGPAVGVARYAMLCYAMPCATPSIDQNSLYWSPSVSSGRRKAWFMKFTTAIFHWNDGRLHCWRFRE